MNRTLKPKKCRICARTFTPISSLSKVCSVPCSLEWARKVAAQKAARAKRDERKSLREALEKAKTRGMHLRELQTAFNAWIRQRDAGLPCISCGRAASWRGQWDAGHYRSVGSNPASRFDPFNVNKQCGPCNVHLSGNLIAYRVGLVRKIGLEAVERLEGPHLPLKLTVPEIVEMKTFYRAEVRRLRKEAA
ncbi:recombination protein NinG [Paraburkholderia unamae]|uniref:NinG protein n=1 Tax=Paraburkholderia unamae TaxID=219649 RepID=A0ABX5K6U8_9BURK|nr:recombination protein NinG [Paraburkholderia unamae]PVX61261.1 NinG protein [Paraburkholderia unamae]